LLIVTPAWADRARDAGEEGGEARARSGREIEPLDRHPDRDRGDVDDPAEAPLHHLVDRRLNQLDRGHHVPGHPGQHGLARQLAEILERRPAGVGHQDVRIGQCGEQLRLAVRHGDVGRHGRDLGARLPPQLFRGRLEAGVVDR
jgi:hypothetical protein